MSHQNPVPFAPEIHGPSPTRPDSGPETRKYRALPHSETLEQTLLGAILLDNKVIEKVGDFLRPEHFFFRVNGRIYEAAYKLNDRGQTATPLTLKTYFENDPDLAHVGGGDYIDDLAGSVVTTLHAQDWGRQIYDFYLRRELIRLGTEISENAYDASLDEASSDQIEQAERKLFELAETGEVQGGFLSLKESAQTALKMAEKAFANQGSVVGVTTGLRDLDRKLGGMHSSDLLILAARPSMGKTALASVIGFNAAKAYLRSNGQEGARTAFFALEMSADQMAARIIANQADIASDRIRRGAIDDHEFQRYVEAASEIENVPFFIDDTPGLSIAALRARARRHKRLYGLDLIIVDYLQLMRGSGSRQAENRVLEISEITRGLKALAKELNVPVMALSQLSRAVEQRDDKRPQLADLRESGAIEQDADMVMFVYREEYYHMRQEPKDLQTSTDPKDIENYQKWQEKLARVANIAECVVAKQRHGPIGTVEMFFDGSLTRFADLDRNHTV